MNRLAILVLAVMVLGSACADTEMPDAKPPSPLADKVPTQVSEAERAVLMKECLNEGTPESCKAWVALKPAALSDAPDSPDTRAVYKNACEADDFESCRKYGEMLYFGQGGEIDLEASRAAAKKGCEGGDARSCYHYGIMLYNAKGGGSNHQGARKAYQKSCEGGDPNGCYNYGVMLNDGVGGNQA